MAEKLKLLDLKADRTDAVPTDPETHKPTSNLPAYYINRLVYNLWQAENTINQLIDEVNALRDAVKDTGNPYPTLLHKFILWGRNAGGAKPGFIPDDTGKPNRLLFAGSPDWDAYGVRIRPTGPAGPRYAYVDVPGLDLTKPCAIWALVRETGDSEDGTAFVAAASKDTGRGYFAAVKQGGSNLIAHLRTIDDSHVINTDTAPGTGPLPNGGNQWKLMELGKHATAFFVGEHVRRANGNTDWQTRRNLNEGITSKFAPRPDQTRIACGIIPRDLDTGELKGLGTFTLGALLIMSTVPSQDVRQETYSAVRQQQQQDNVAEVLPVQR